MYLELIAIASVVSLKVNCKNSSIHSTSHNLSMQCPCGFIDSALALVMAVNNELS